MVDRTPRRQVMRQHAPRTAAAHELKDTVQDLALGIVFRSAAGLGLGHEMLDQVPLVVGKIAGGRRLGLAWDKALTMTSADQGGNERCGDP